MDTSVWVDHFRRGHDRLVQLLAYIEREALYGQGCGMVDIALLSAARLTPRTCLWTFDEPLAARASRVGVHWIDEGV